LRRKISELTKDKYFTDTDGNKKYFNQVNNRQDLAISLVGYLRQAKSLPSGFVENAVIETKGKGRSSSLPPAGKGKSAPPGAQKAPLGRL
jgi:hypothetical protein